MSERLGFNGQSDDLPDRLPWSILTNLTVPAESNYSGINGIGVL